MENTTCTGTAMPDIHNLPVPQDINVMVTSNVNLTASRMGMEACCQPNTVNAIDDCYLWCEIPASFLNGTNKDGAANQMQTCVSLNSTGKGRGITGFQLNGSAAARPGMGSVKGIAFWVLALSGLMYVL
ncbi:hypothetical protein N658DRAFT_497562 [Parathielavia hyrcaniae]|uniref:Uncharacterized protein n=1 Tax=Parathielavia hyrcaniae TaxID=113614 RepID=A0AAN6T010_9PEZI|nr:hypothetical protein N658DRAFT_497562 [Parathielavia hyrcaniae]